MDEIYDIPLKFERGPSNLFLHGYVDASIDVIKKTLDTTTIVV